MKCTLATLILATLSLALTGCSSGNKVDMGHLCTSGGASLGSETLVSQDIGNTHYHSDHQAILEPSLAWELEIGPGFVPTRQLPIFNHLVGLIYFDENGTRIEFIDGLLGIPVRTDALPEGSMVAHVAEGKMLVSTDSNQLYLYDLGTGRTVWGFQENQSIRFSPVIVDGTIFLSSGTSLRERGEVLAIDFESGETIWSGRTPIVDGNSYPILSAKLAVSSQAVIVNGFGWFYALDFETGEKCWDTESSKYGLASQANIPSTDGELVLFEAEGELYGVSITNGDIVWKSDGFMPVSNIAISGDFAITVGEDGDLVSVDLTDGGVRWARGEFDYSLAEILVAGEVVYATTSTGELNALELDTGELIWSLEVGEVSTQLYADHKRLYVLTDTKLISVVNITP